MSTPPRPSDGNDTTTRPVLSDQTNYLPFRKIISVFLACATFNIVGLFDETMVAVSLQKIGTDLNAGTQVSWVATAYFVTSTAFQLVYGRFSDIWSRKQVLLTLLFVFFIGNLGSAFAKTFIQLAIFRAISGIGGGGIPTVGQVIISDVVSLRQRGKYQGILGVSVAIGNGFGPLIGGLLSEHTSWRWIFRLTLPLAAISALMALLFMPLKTPEGSWREKLPLIDFLGVILVLAASILTTLSLTWAGGSYSWSDAHVVAPLALGVLLFVAFGIWEWKCPTIPLLPLYIFRKPIVIAAAITQFINGYVSVVQVFYLPTFYQLAYGYSPVKSGLLLLPLTVVQTFASTLSGFIVTWSGRYRELILSGWAMWSIGLGLLATLNPQSTLAQQIGYSIFTGLGVGQTFQPSLVAVQGALERKDMAIVTALRSFVRNLGGSLGLAITGTVVNGILKSRLKQLQLSEEVRKSILDRPESARALDQASYTAVLDAYHHGFRVIFIMLAVLASVAFLTAFCLMHQKTLDRDDDDALRQQGKEFIASRSPKGALGVTAGKDSGAHVPTSSKEC